MAIVTVPGGLWIPRPPLLGGAPAMSFIASLTGSTHKAAVICQAPKTGNIRKIVWGTRTVTTGATVDVRVETLDETVAPATPSGTLFGTNTNGSQVVANGDDNVTFTTTLTADAAVTQSNRLAIVIANAGSGNMQAFSALAAPSGTRPSALPYAISYNGSVWGAASSITPMVGLEYDDGSYEPVIGIYPTASSITTHTISTSTTPDVVGLRFRFTFDCQVLGIWAVVSSGGDFAARLVTSAYHQANATGILASYVKDADVRAATPSPEYYIFQTPQDITASTWYRAIMEPTTTTSISVYSLPTASAAQMDGWEGGADFMTSTAKDPTGDGDWTNLNSGTFAQPFIGLILSGFDDGTGGGGGGERSYAFSG